MSPESVRLVKVPLKQIAGSSFFNSLRLLDALSVLLPLTNSVERGLDREVVWVVCLPNILEYRDGVRHTGVDCIL